MRLACPPALLLALLLGGCASPRPGGIPDAADYNRRLGRGINLGNALEAPSEGDWGVRAEDAYFTLMRDAGFTSVRVPVRWSAHADTAPPYAIDTNFLGRVDHVVRAALRADLAVALNIHHYGEVMDHPSAERDRFLALWDQIARHYRTWPGLLSFELLNEPHGELDDARWSELAGAALRVVRASNPRRVVIVGPAQWNNPHHLAHLGLPEQDRQLIATFHYYEPFMFTHQGAGWVPGAEAWSDVTWRGTPDERRRIEGDLDEAARWARAHDRPLWCGEFGAYSRADMASRERWTFFVSRALEERGCSWAYWEFCAGFGAYDPQAQAWRQPLLDALVPPPGR